MLNLKGHFMIMDKKKKNRYVSTTFCITSDNSLGSLWTSFNATYHVYRQASELTFKFGKNWFVLNIIVPQQ